MEPSNTSIIDAPLLHSLQESREAAAVKKEKMDAMMREHKKAERELIKKGKKPFHIKKCKLCMGEEDGGKGRDVTRLYLYSYSEENWTGPEICKVEEIWEAGEVHEQEAEKEF